MSNILNQMANRSALSRTENGALSYATSGFQHLGACLDYWTKAGTYTNRDQSAVDADMVKIFADDADVATRIVFGLRLITRKYDGMEDVQTGYGRKDEFYKCLVWMHHNKKDLLYKNLNLIPVFGCWKDLLAPPLIKLLDRKEVYSLVMSNIGIDPLLAKYLPQIRSKKNVRNDRDSDKVNWANGLCYHMGISHKEYRKIKSGSSAHVWQQQMSAKQWNSIDFNRIPGKAMLLHTSQTGEDNQTVFERHNQTERLVDWVSGQDKVKFTGYPYELTRAAKSPNFLQKVIYNKQFETILEPMRNHKLGNVLACLDTSGSMQAECMPGVSAYDICVSMGLVFSSLNVGNFKDAVVAFDSVSKLVRLKGTFCDKLNQINTMTTAWGSTNFQSVIDLLVRIRTSSPQIPVTDYPETLLVISDMQFNPVGNRATEQTNYEAAMQKLRSVGLNNVRIIWWFVNGRGTDFPAQMDDEGVYMIGGFDPINLKSLMGLHAEKSKSSLSEKKTSSDGEESPKDTPLDGMKNFLSQKIFDLVK